MTTTPPSAAQTILSDTAKIRADIETILALANTVAVPMEGEKASFLNTVIELLGMIVKGVDETQQSLAALHQRLEEPGIAAALRRVIIED